jgi:hypothetical protein
MELDVMDPVDLRTADFIASSAESNIAGMPKANRIAQGD